MGRVDGVAVVGQVLGQLMQAGGAAAQGAEVLRKSARAFRKLNQEQRAQQVEGLIRAEQIEEES